MVVWETRVDTCLGMWEACIVVAIVGVEVGMPVIVVVVIVVALGVVVVQIVV